MILDSEKSKNALIIVDVQYDFCEGGSLEVRNSNEIIPLINRLRTLKFFDLVVLTRDWHPKTHTSFAENHPGTKLFEMIRLEDTGVDQVMWPTHCVQGSKGAKFHSDLHVKEGDIVINKGQLINVDSYSGFGSYPEQTELEKVLRENEIKNVYTVGLAYDYCVGSTAYDAAIRGFKTFLIQDATRSVAESSEKIMTEKLLSVGV